ncbi:phospholipid-translocating P-type ATPase domain-containing protein [Talaromyces proteolyticus]|uniref:Phospholipid-transporting ATPase n=1 Tax=Talaromyces proteolyticus TaxID=1131652 RepID=A0AAD4PYQ0_9EURO|nr:phospholipid-translocating P-type ATPase domain-containing protein [Talaromyces proteolyticus]KAH8695037.1 phospholipid-translocating P-type ATPase domain-containing protein [Talaromyces proteolyticus]
MAVVQFAGDGNGNNHLQPPSNDLLQPTNSEISKPTKRQRWATQRKTNSGGLKKRVSIVDRFHRRNHSKDEKRKSGASSADGTNETPTEDGEPEQEPSRRVYFNCSIPDSERDEEGNLKAHYPRNKIRTAKYTPLNFIPKNLWLQFHNIANVYFLFIIILGFFAIFGVTNPGMNAVPLIFIIVVTALKDAIEDWRRTVLDAQLNNSPVYRLADWENVNVSEEDVSAWRRFKKACTRTVIATYRAMKGGKNKQVSDGNEDERRMSMATYRQSIYSTRDSYYGANEQDAIQMTPVSSPHQEAHVNGWPDEVNGAGTNGSVQPGQSVPEHVAAGTKKSGSLVDRYKQTPQKARFKREHWKSVQVGDFVRLYNGDQIPADIVIISSSDPDGACYVETKNLDGETNLKVRQALHCGREVKHARDCEKCEFVVESEAPHANLYAYSAAIRWPQRDPANPEGPRKEMVEPININNLLLRGCSLQNTEWILGVVVFTGPETKIMLNSGETPTKRPRLAREMNWNVITNFTILFIMCLITGFINGFVWALTNGSLTFFDFGSYGGSPAAEGVVAFFTGLILFQNLVPIALYISLEIVRTFQALFIYFDKFMVYERLDMACVPKSWNISDDLGQIEYIFSDKTGTLTQNVMEFKKCTINGVSYGEAYTEAQLGMQRREGIDVEVEAAKARQKIADGRVRMLQLLRNIHDNPYLKDENLTFVSPDYVESLAGKSGREQQQATESFMIALALCHTVITEHTPGDPPQIEFKAQSPDEAALVATARDCGFTVLGRNGDDLILNVMGEERTYTVLNTLEFNSTRKRMSAIIRMPDGTIRLFCKGADSIIYNRLARGKQQALRKTTAEHLELFAREGLRTLCVAERILGEEEYRVWNESHDLAAQALTDREEKLEEVSSAIEQELMLLGGTAIEDRLQDGVPDTISLLADAGIKLWVLTGDKVETAINIGFSCNLLNNDMELIVFNIPADQPELASAELEKNLAKLGVTGSDEELIAARQDHSAPPSTHALVIDGDALKLMLDDELKQKFLILCKQCKAVLCCRVSPAQKAAVVRMVKNGLNIMALSIGDGANDVAMIQEADVGVGIAGEEGRQAVMSSDYAVGQFRFLQRLILVHGRWSYRRLGETTANFFYKNIVWTVSLFWYSIYNNFDGSYLFDSTYIVLVNLAFTSLPVIFMGIFDQDVDDKISLAVPQLYMRGIERKEWSPWKFWFYMFDGFYQSLMCFFMPYLLYAPATFQRGDGLALDDRQQMGILVASAAVVASNTYILLNTYRWDWLTVLINSISSLLIYFWTGVYSSTIASAQFYRHGAEVFGSLSYWTVFLVTVVLCLLPRFVIKSVQKVFFPTDVDIIREQASQGRFKYLEKFEAYVPPATKAVGEGESPVGSDTSAVSSVVKPIEPQVRSDPTLDEDERPIYPPSIAPTITTHNPRSQNGSNGTNSTAESFDFGTYQRHHHWDREPQPGLTVNRKRSSANSSDFPNGNLLARIESAGATPQSPHSPLRRPYDVHAV